MFDLFVLQQTAQRSVERQFESRPQARAAAPAPVIERRPARRAASALVLRLRPAADR